jgi:hypothetical protein
MDPEAIDHARRSGVRGRLITAGISVDEADAWLRSWEREAALRSLPRDGAAFWDQGYRWIRDERAAERRPPA